MASLKNMAIAETIANDSRIQIKKGFLGLSTSIIYTPTHSKMKCLLLDYAPAEGEKVERLLKANESQLKSLIDSIGEIKRQGMGNVRLELCITEDHSFAIAQLFRFVDFKQIEIDELKCFEGENAKLIASAIL